jgi:uncharacterized protein (DUF1778 family)
VSILCHRCGPVRHEAPTVLCAPCVLDLEATRIVLSDEDFARVWAEVQNPSPPTPALIELMRVKP